MQQKMNEYKASYEQNKVAADNLRLKLEEMRKQLTLKNKRETLVARVNAAKHKRILIRRCLDLIQTQQKLV